MPILVPGAPLLGVRRQRLLVPGGTAPPAINVPQLIKLTRDARWVAEGDSITAGSNGPQWEEYADAATGGRFFRPVGWNQAVGGETAKQMAGEVAAVTALGPALVTFLGGTNDLTSSDQDDAATIYGNIKTCVLAYLQGGAMYVVVCPILPRFDDTFTQLGNFAAREQVRKDVNTMLASLPQDPDITASFVGRVKVCANQDGLWFKNQDYIDTGLHPNLSGARKLGMVFAASMNSISDTTVITDLFLDPSSLLTVSGTDNPQLAGTAGVVSNITPGNLTGVVADGWTGETNDTSLKAVFSKGMINGAEAQVIQISGTNETVGHLVNFRNPIVVTGNPGDAFEAAIDVRLEAGSVGVQNVLASCSTAGIPQAGATVRGNFDGLAAFQGTIRTPQISTETAAITSVTGNFQIVFEAGPVSATITWGRPFVRLITPGELSLNLPGDNPGH